MPTESTAPKTSSPSSSSAAKNSGAQPYQRFVPGQVADAAVRAVEKIHQEFLRAVESDMGALFQQPVTVTHAGTVQSSVALSINSSEAGDHVAVLDLSPVPARSYLIFPRQMLFRMLDLLLASPDASSETSAEYDQASDESAEPRTVTAIELHILRECFDLCARALKRAWEPVYALAFELLPDPEGGSASAPEVADEPALVLESAITLAGVSFSLSVVLPAFLARFAELKMQPRAGQEADQPVRQSMLTTLGEATVTFDAVLGGARLCVSDILRLAPGQIVSLGLPESQAIDCRINGRQQFGGELVVSGARRGIQIAEVLPERFSDIPASTSAAER
jgi:flagellar motor switch protein FliN/FliY